MGKPMETDTGQELESKLPVSPGFVMSPSGAGSELPIPVPPPPPPRQAAKPQFWRDSEQSQKSTQLGGSQHRTQACKLLAGWWRYSRSSREFQHSKHRDRNPKSQQYSRTQPARGHSTGMTSWWDWRPGTAGWRRDAAHGFTQQLAQWNFHEQQKYALNMVRTLPCYNCDENVRTHWCEHVSKSNQPMYEATRVKLALLRLQVQGYATVETGQDEVFNSEQDDLDAREGNASCREKESMQSQRRRAPSDASTEYASRRSSTRSEEEHLPGDALQAISQDTLTVEELANYWENNKEKTKQEPSRNTCAHTSSKESVDESENLCVAHVDGGAAELVPEESRYERRRRERRGMRHRGGRRKEMIAEKSDLRMDNILDSLRQLNGQDSMMGLLLGWMLGRVFSVVLSQLTQPVRRISGLEVSEALSTPMPLVAACLVAIWLGSMAVNRMGTHPSWQLGCLAAWVFTLVS